MLFSLLPGVGEMRRLRVGLTLYQEANNWVLSIDVNDKDLHEVAQAAR